MKFRVVQCAECKLFQVDMVKKAIKWTCKVCNTKQTIGQILYSSDLAKDCRIKVQKLNVEYHKDGDGVDKDTHNNNDILVKKKSPIFSFSKSLEATANDQAEGGAKMTSMNTENVERTDGEILALLEG